jgi:hypothetical protein
MRCNLSPAYEWPEDAPYASGEVTTVQVASHGSHYVPDPTEEWPKALCGFSWAPEEGEPTAGEPSCPECRREPLLVKFLRSSEQQQGTPRRATPHRPPSPAAVAGAQQTGDLGDRLG